MPVEWKLDEQPVGFEASIMALSPYSAVTARERPLARVGNLVGTWHGSDCKEQFPLVKLLGVCVYGSIRGSRDIVGS